MSWQEMESLSSRLNEHPTAADQPCLQWVRCSPSRWMPTIVSFRSLHPVMQRGGKRVHAGHEAAWDHRYIRVSVLTIAIQPFPFWRLHLWRRP